MVGLFFFLSKDNYIVYITRLQIKKILVIITTNKTYLDTAKQHKFIAFCVGSELSTIKSGVKKIISDISTE